MCIARRVIFDEYPPIIIDSNDILEDYGIFYYTSANVYEPNRKRTKSELEALLSSRDRAAEKPKHPIIRSNVTNSGSNYVYGLLVINFSCGCPSTQALKHPWESVFMGQGNNKHYKLKLSLLLLYNTLFLIRLTITELYCRIGIN